MGGSKNKPAGETTTKTAPWEGAQPYWSQMYADIFGKPSSTGTPSLGGNSSWSGALKDRMGNQISLPSNYTGKYGDGGLLGQTQFVGANPNIQSAWDMVQQRAGQPSQMLQGAEGYATDVLSGKYLDPSQNLALAQNLQRGMADIGGGWDSSANQSGRYGSGAWAAGRGQQLADLQGNLYGQGLNQMTQVAGMAPSIYEAGYLPAQKMLALGDAQRQMAQEEQMFPWEMYGMGANLLSGAPGGTSSSPYFKPNPLMGALGGAGAGAAFGPYGAAAGGALGLLGSK